MTKLYLVDSRNRIANPKRIMWRFKDHYTGVVQAWTVVLTAEVRNPASRKDYVGMYAPTSNTSIAEYCEVFNDFWCEYGWYLVRMDAPPDAKTATIVRADRRAVHTF